jgi:hypothetical protein
MSAGGVCPAESVATGVRRRGRTQSAAERAHKPDSRPHVKTNAPETGLANRRISTPRALKPAPHAPNRGATRPRPSTHGAAWSSRRHQRAGRGARAPRKAPNASEEPRSSRGFRSDVRGLGRPRAKKSAERQRRATLEQTGAVRTRAGWGARAPKKSAERQRRATLEQTGAVRTRAGWGARAPKTSAERQRRATLEQTGAVRRPARFSVSPSKRRRACARGRGSRGGIGC